MSFYKKMNITAILTTKLKVRMVFLIGLILIGTLFEIAGISLIIPVIMIIMEPAFIIDYPQVGVLVSYFIEPTHTNAVILGISSLILFYVLKTFYLVFLAFKQGAFIYKVKEEIGSRLFYGYMRKPYEFYLQHNSAQLIRNLSTEVANLGVVLRAAMTLFIDGIVMIAVVILLVFIEPIGTITIFCILVSSSFFFQYLTKNKLLKFGEKRQFHDGKRLQHIQQGLSSIKNVKILSREDIFVERFSKHNSAGVEAERFQYVMASMPRLFLEFVVVIGLAALVTTQVMNGKSVESISLVLSVYAVAIFRLLPSFNRMLAALQQIRFCLPSLNVIGDELRKVGDLDGIISQDNQHINNIKTPDLLQKIRIANLSFKHAGVNNYALKNISLEILKGNFVGIIGGSGAGKSTLVDLMLGLLAPSEGLIEVDGKNIHHSIKSWQAQLGYVPQHIDLVDDTIRNNIAFGVQHSQINDAFIAKAVESAQLNSFIEELPEGLDTFIGEHGVRLSGGQRQRIGIARALYLDPKILILDEATSALDMNTESEIMETINALHGKKTVILVSHRLQTLVNCDMIYRIEAGCLVGSGTHQQVITLED